MCHITDASLEEIAEQLVLSGPVLLEMYTTLAREGYALVNLSGDANCNSIVNIDSNPNAFGSG